MSSFGGDQGLRVQGVALPVPLLLVLFHLP